MRNKKIYITTSEGTKIRITALQSKRYRRIRAFAKKLKWKCEIMYNGRVRCFDKAGNLIMGGENGKSPTRALKFLSDKVERKKEEMIQNQKKVMSNAE